jgi:heptose I phosphotransferase
MYSFVKYSGLTINDCFLDFLKDSGLADFQILKNCEGGKLFKKNKFRSVTRIEIQDRIFYLKKHFWPLRERAKSLIPWIKREDAINEWENLVLLDRLGIKTMVPVAFGEQRRFGVPCFSLTLTENIYDAEKMETYLPAHFSPPLSADRLVVKRALIRKLADFARDFHDMGLNHQDFYLGHLYLRPQDGAIFVIDIQRLHQRKFISRHDLIKDLAQLAYSCQRLRIFTRTDFMRFIHVYLGKDRLARHDKRLIRKIAVKAGKIACHDAKLQTRKQVKVNT